MTLWIGLTGGIGSGKSQAAKIFSDLGVPHIDADALSRNLTADNGIALPAIRRLFGDKVFHTQNSLNRAALRDLVFRRPHAKKELEEVLLPLILNEIKSAKTRYPSAAYGIIDVPLLIENPEFLAAVDRVLVIDVSEATQILRVQQRSGLDTEEIKRIMNTQANRKTRLLYADDVLENEGTLSELTKKIQGLHRFYSGLTLNQYGVASPCRTICTVCGFVALS